MKDKKGVVRGKESTKCVISAKIPPELLEKMDEMQKGLGIGTRNELIIRAIRLCYASYRYGIEQEGGIR